MIEEIIAKAYKEDIPSQDVTTASLGVTDHFGMAQLIAKQDLVLSGASVFEKCLKHIDAELSLSWQFADGDEVLKSQTVAQISGNLVALIQAERVSLNFLGFLSGIATETHQFSEACRGTNTKILDTRKTLPLYRSLSKAAVCHGGGENHRMNLSDAILIKENHITIAGGLKQAVELIRKNSQLPIEVETKNKGEVEMAVELQVSRIMLDNMNLEEMRDCLEIIPDGIETEASGNMTLDRIPQVAALGVNYISVGALTHSAPIADFSLLFDWS